MDSSSATREAMDAAPFYRNWITEKRRRQELKRRIDELEAALSRANEVLWDLVAHDHVLIRQGVMKPSLEFEQAKSFLDNHLQAES